MFPVVTVNLGHKDTALMEIDRTLPGPKSKITVLSLHLLELFVYCLIHHSPYIDSVAVSWFSSSSLAAPYLPVPMSVSSFCLL